MFEVKENTNQISFTFDSKVLHVNRVIEESHIFLHQLIIEDSELSNLNLVLRELINNAVEHGNKGNKEKTVFCSVTHLDKKRFKIEVHDQGEGFQYNAIDWEIPLDPRQTRNRGLALINTFSDQIKFNNNGNQVTVFMNLVRDTDFQLDRQGELLLITPYGNITAAEEKKFRALLESLLDNGAFHFRFDFRNVDDIDSVSLSVMIVFSKMLAKKKRWKLEIINLNNDLRKLFQLTRVDRIFDVLEDENDERDNR
jgi:serine/threonine-protein kinase RsbW